MVQYVIAGLVLGAIYAIASAGIVVTYQSAGILNFAFGSLAFFVARCYYFLHVEHGWGILAAAAVSIVVVGPLLGVLLYALLFRLLRLSPPLIKIVATLGLSVTIPPIASLIFGERTIFSVPGLAPEPVHVFHVFGVAVTLDQVFAYIAVLVTVVAGSVVLRFTDVGLRVRAMVDSPALTSLAGTNPGAVSVGVWAVSTFLAGLAGVLAAPIIGLSPSAFTLLMASAFAAVIAAKLRNLPTAVVVGLIMGIIGSLVQGYLPPQSSFTAAVIPSIPFAVTAVCLVYHMIRTGRVNEASGVGGALDRAIAVHADQAAVRIGRGTRRAVRSVGLGPALIALVVIALVPLVLHGFWVGLFGQGVAYGVVFLAFTLATGEGGMVWLCVATFAGIGGLGAAQLATQHGWPVTLAIVAGGVIALPFGLVIGLLTIRLGDLYVALVTLTFGLLMENLVFSRQVFDQQGLGVVINRPSYAADDKAFTYLALAIFAIIGLFIVNVRRSTTGMALSAVRSSEAGAKTIGISVMRMKVIVSGVAAAVAGIGGALLAVADQVALPTNYAALTGVIWLAVLATQGIRSNTAALIAGLTLTIFPGITSTYLPTWVNQVPPILFGLGAVMVARNPDGLLAMQARQLRAVVERLRRTPAHPIPGTAGQVPHIEDGVSGVPLSIRKRDNEEVGAGRTITPAASNGVAAAVRRKS